MSKFTLIDKAFFLKRNILFGTLDLDLLLAIADKLSIVTYDAKDPIFSVNEDAHRMYFIVKGIVEISGPDGNVLAVLGIDDFFGDESIFNEKRRAYSAISKTDCILLTLSRTNLLSIISESPAVAVGLLQAYTSMTSFRPRMA